MLRNCSSTGWHAAVELASALTRLVWTFFFSNWLSVEKHLELQWLLLVDLLDNMIMPRSENVASFFSSCNFPMFSQLAFRNRLLKHTLFHCFSQSLEAHTSNFAGPSWALQSPKCCSSKFLALFVYHFCAGIDPSTVRRRSLNDGKPSAVLKPLLRHFQVSHLLHVWLILKT